MDSIDLFFSSWSFSQALIRALLEHTSDPHEVRRMQELCSKEGAKEYSQFIRESNVSLLDFLYSFPSCKPPVETLLGMSVFLFCTCSDQVMIHCSLSYTNFVCLQYSRSQNFQDCGPPWLSELHPYSSHAYTLQLVLVIPAVSLSISALRIFTLPIRGTVPPTFGFTAVVYLIALYRQFPHFFGGYHPSFPNYIHSTPKIFFTQIIQTSSTTYS